MTTWQKHPIIYEINTFVWLTALSQRYGWRVTLVDLPEEVISELAAMNIDAVWFMGVWQRNPEGQQSARNYVHEYRGALADINDADVVGSAYAVGAYVVDARLGGREGLAAVRARLAAHGIRVILDFVPNHVGTDHEWIAAQPAYFVWGTTRDQAKRPDLFFTRKDVWGRTVLIAHGRDPYFPSWIDTAQLNAFDPGYRRAAVQTLLDIASQCDGVRCDMAMLATNRIFQQTWAGDVDSPPMTEFWVEVIPQIKAQYPEFVFIAEVYWGMEYELQQQGFDYTYDKLLYDRILEGSAQKVREHLYAPLAYQRHLVRFIENHDEPRAATALGPVRSIPAAVLMLTLPGAALLHDGQFTGRRIKLPVQISRQPDEPEDRALAQFYRQLLAETRHNIYREGDWRLLNVARTHEENDNEHHIVAYGWRNLGEYRLIAVNMSKEWVHGLITLHDWSELAHEDWTLRDMLNDTHYFRLGRQIVEQGLYVELKPFSAHIFRFERAAHGTHDADYGK